MKRFLTAMLAETSIPSGKHCGFRALSLLDTCSLQLVEATK